MGTRTQEDDSADEEERINSYDFTWGLDSSQTQLKTFKLHKGFVLAFIFELWIPFNNNLADMEMWNQVYLWCLKC
jgi:hypothetical protein